MKYFQAFTIFNKNIFEGKLKTDESSFKYLKFIDKPDSSVDKTFKQVIETCTIPVVTDPMVGDKYLNDILGLSPLDLLELDSHSFEMIDEILVKMKEESLKRLEEIKNKTKGDLDV